MNAFTLQPQHRPHQWRDLYSHPHPHLSSSRQEHYETLLNNKIAEIGTQIQPTGNATLSSYVGEIEFNGDDISKAELAYFEKLHQERLIGTNEKFYNDIVTTTLNDTSTD